MAASAQRHPPCSGISGGILLVFFGLLISNQLKIAPKMLAKRHKRAHGPKPRQKPKRKRVLLPFNERQLLKEQQKLKALAYPFQAQKSIAQASEVTDLEKLLEGAGTDGGKAQAYLEAKLAGEGQGFSRATSPGHVSDVEMRDSGAVSPASGMSSSHLWTAVAMDRFLERAIDNEMATIRSKGFQEFEEASYAAISPIPGSPGALISAHVKHILAYRRLRDRLSEYVSSKDATGELGDLLEEGGEGEGGKQEQGVLKGKGLDIRRMNLDKMAATTRGKRKIRHAMKLMFGDVWETAIKGMLPSNVSSLVCSEKHFDDPATELAVAEDITVPRHLRKARKVKQKKKKVKGGCNYC